jgi:branched-chain amino acid transport system substrate-binding protein
MLESLRVPGMKETSAAGPAAVCFLVLMLTGCGAFASETSPGAALNEFKIGVTFPLSGPVARLGQESLNATEVAVDLVNEAGGVNGQEVSIVSADTPDAATGVNEANRLIDREGVGLIFGSYSSSISLAVSAVAERKSVVYWEEAAVDAEITEREYRYVLRSNPTSDDYGETAVAFAEDTLAPRLGVDPTELKVALVSEDSSYGQAVNQAATRAVEDRGMRLVANEAYSQTTVDLSSLVLTVREAQPDVIVATQYLNDAILFSKQARELGLRTKAIIGTGAGHSNADLAKSAGEDAEGILNVSTPSGIDTSKLPEEAQALGEEFQSRYREEFGADAGPSGQQAFVGMYLLLTEVLPQAGGMDPDEIMAAAKALDVPEGQLINGWGARFGEDGQNERAFPSVMQWQGDRLYTVSPEDISGSELENIPLQQWE